MGIAWEYLWVTHGYTHWYTHGRGRRASQPSCASLLPKFQGAPHGGQQAWVYPWQGGASDAAYSMHTYPFWLMVRAYRSPKSLRQQQVAYAQWALTACSIAGSVLLAIAASVLRTTVILPTQTYVTSVIGLIGPGFWEISWSKSGGIPHPCLRLKHGRMNSGYMR